MRREAKLAPYPNAQYAAVNEGEPPGFRGHGIQQGRDAFIGHRETVHRWK